MKINHKSFYFKQQDVTKSTSWTPLRFFGNSRAESKKRSMDDSFISVSL